MREGSGVRVWAWGVGFGVEGRRQRVEVEATCTTLLSAACVLSSAACTRRVHPRSPFSRLHGPMTPPRPRRSSDSAVWRSSGGMDATRRGALRTACSSLSIAIVRACVAMSARAVPSAYTQQGGSHRAMALSAFAARCREEASHSCVRRVDSWCHAGQGRGSKAQGGQEGAWQHAERVA